VREGMEITTLIKWEKTLGLFEEQNALNGANTRPIQETANGSPAARRVKNSVTRSPKQPQAESRSRDSEIGQLLDRF